MNDKYQNEEHILMNFTTLEKLQYQELKDIIKSYCVSGLGKQLLDKLMPSSNLAVVKTRLNETTEARVIVDAEGHVPFLGVSNIEHIMTKLAKGMILDPSELISMSDFLRGCRNIKKFMLDKEFFAPVLSSYANSMAEFKSVEEEINFAIKANRVDSAASRELKRIRHHIETTEEKIKDRLTKFLNNSANKTYIQEFFISQKDERYTIPIKASYKNHVQGTIVEISSKGATVFMEPSVVAKLNGELATLKAEEAVEEYQILASLSGLLMDHLHALHINMELISQYDMVFAKAKFSKQIGGMEPRLNDYGYIQVINGRHPLLPGNAVPLQFTIGKDYRSLIITGPNAGGKTVVLKTIGFLTLATMSGFHIVADEGTELAIFDHIFVDIGDNQSMENALSTFSSHMKNLSDIMRASNNHTLLLFDEIGSGTEPNEGAALAIAILEEFYQMGCMTVATTHYGEIKRFSEMHPDFMNAAMRFNSETLEPLYQLMIGTSGESNALWISKKMNVRAEVLQRAQDYMNNKDYQLTLVQDSKIRKPKVEKAGRATIVEFAKGDRVKLLDHDDVGLVYQEMNQFFNVTVYYKGQMLEIHVKRLALELPATELYPEGYDLETLFVGYQERKLQHDIERGSKKALRKIHKQIKEDQQK